MNPQKIGEFIKTLRIENNMSQTDLANTLNISRQSVSKWERGINIPDSSTLVLLSEIFKVTIDELLLGKKIKKKERESENISLTLSMLDDTKKKNRIIKRLTTTLVLLLIIFTCYLVYYFLSSYNSISVYSINSLTDDFYIEDGIFIKTDNEMYFLLGNILSTNHGKEKNIEGLKLFYKDGNNEKLIKYGTGRNIFIEDDNKNQNFDSNNINYILDNLYLRLYMKDEEILIKLKAEKKFANTKLIFKY